MITGHKERSAGQSEEISKTPQKAAFC